jgi:predicted phage gp36 major capsid-like protein
VADLEQEWAIGYRDETNGEVRITPRFYATREEAESWFNYLCTDWREELEEKARTEEEDEKRSKAKGKGLTTNWARMTLKGKKKERHLLVMREVTPYTLVREAPEWS